MSNAGFVHVYETGTTDVIYLFYNIEIDFICYIGPDAKIDDTVGPYTFGYQFDTTVSIILGYNQKTHDQKKFSTLATLFSTDIYMTASSRGDAPTQL
jgi:hypothetical protein